MVDKKSEIKMIKKDITILEQDIKIEGLRWDVKFMTNVFFILVTIVSLSIGFFLYYENESFYTSFSPKTIDTDVFDLVEIIYEDLTTEEIAYFDSVFKNVKPAYLAKTDKVIVTKDIKKYCKGNACGGSQFGKTITVKYKRIDSEIKRVVTHELLHSWIPSSGGNITNPGHSIVNELGKRHVAFIK